MYTGDKYEENGIYNLSDGRKKVLTEIAEEKKWTMSFLSEEIIREGLMGKHPERMESQEI